MFAGFGAPDTVETSRGETGSVVIEECTLDYRCTISEFAKSDFCRDNILLENLKVSLYTMGVGVLTVPQPRQITFPEAVSSSIFVGLGQFGQLYAIFVDEILVSLYLGLLMDGIQAEESYLSSAEKIGHFRVR